MRGAAGRGQGVAGLGRVGEWTGKGCMTQVEGVGLGRATTHNGLTG